MAYMIYQTFYVGILFKWKRQVCIYIWTFQTGIFGARMLLTPEKIYVCNRFKFI